VPFMIQCGKTRYSQAGHRLQYNAAMRFACRITKARIQTHSGHLILTAFPRQQWSRERA